MTASVSPFVLRMAIAYLFLVRPADLFTEAEWGSRVADDARCWLVQEDLILNGQPTEKLKVWMDRILATPLPVRVWAYPDQMA